MTDQSKTLNALQTSIQMEIDGKKFYLTASQQSTNDVGKQLLKQLAAEEDIHRKAFEKIYESLRAKNAWPQVEITPKASAVTLFAEAAEKLGKTRKGPATELAAVKTALSMENKSYDFYEAQLAISSDETEKSFYKALSAQERGHYQVLQDYYEFLDDTSAYFIRTEHHLIDGG